MRLIVRVAAVVLAALGLIRMAFYLGYAAAMLPRPMEGGPFESKFVLLAYRSQAGLNLYPGWEHYPHVANFFSPLSFITVGLLGRAASADLRALFLIGRALSVGSGLLTSILLGVWAGRRYGVGAGLLAALISVGARPLDGVSVTVRPDLMADLLGVAGFALTGSRSPRWFLAGAGLLILAVFTKQTAAVYLIAAALALTLEGKPRSALALLGGGIGTVLIVVAVVTLTIEPNFARSLVGEAKTPWDSSAWLLLMKRTLRMSPDILVIPALGLWLWARGPTRDLRLAALTVTLLAAGLTTSFKRGADVNYLLGLRVSESMAVAAFWAFSRAAATRRQSLAAAALLAVAAVSLDRIDSEFYDLIITTTDLFGPKYATQGFGLPMPLVERARQHYKPFEQGGGLYVYVPRGRPRGAPPRP